MEVNATGNQITMKNTKAHIQGKNPDEAEYILLGRRVAKVKFLQLIALLLVTVLMVVIALHVALRTGAISPEWWYGYTACLEDGCVQESARILSVMNTSVDPCQDFYQYACGRFSLRHPRGAYASYGVPEMLQEYNDRRIEDILEDLPEDDSAMGKAAVYYRACVSAGNATTERIIELVDIINSMGGMEVLGTWNGTGYNVSEVLAKLIAKHDVGPLFDANTLQQQPDDILIVIPPRIGVSTYHTTEQWSHQRALTLRNKILRGLRLLQTAIDPGAHNCNDSCIEHTADDIIDVYARVTKIYQNRKLPEELLWSDMMTTLGSYIWSTVNEYLSPLGFTPKTVVLPQGDYLEDIGALIRQTPPHKMNNYLMWFLAEEYLWTLDGGTEPPQETHIRVENKNSVTTVRQRACLHQLYRYMQPIMQALFVRTQIGDDLTRTIQYLARITKETMLSNLEWMDEATRRSTQEMIQQTFFDYLPAEYESYGIPVDETYEEMTVKPNDFFYNTQSIKTLFSKHLQLNYNEWKLQRIPVNEDHMDIRPEYFHNFSLLNIPFGAIQPPWFSRHLPIDLNVAAIGSIILRTAIQGLILADSSQNYQQHSKKTKKLIQQYRLCVENTFSRNTKPHQLADSFNGTDQKWHPDDLDNPVAEHLAYQFTDDLRTKTVPSAVTKLKLPGLRQMSSDQLFYLIYAQGRCENTHLSHTDAQEPSQRQIVNRLVHNDPRFREIYQCAETPAEYKEQKECILGATGNDITAP